MIQSPKSFSEHQVAILRDLTGTGITQLAQGGKARAYADIFADKLAELDARKFSDLLDVSIDYATGPNLDDLGAQFGVPRLQQQDSRISPNDTSLKFWVRNGTFGTINNGSPILIPANTRVTTAGTGGPVFLLDTAVLEASADSQYVSARSYLPGTLGNVAERSLTVHNFRDYADFRSGSLLVINDHGVTGGRDRESDDNYRYRILLKIRGRNRVNEAGLRELLLPVPGIRDIVFVPYSGGFYVYLYSISPVVSTEILSTAQRLLNEAVAYPLQATAIAPDLSGISFSTTIKVKPASNAAEKADIVNRAVSEAAHYINNLQVGETLYINSIASRIRSADSRILDVGEVNNQIPEIFIWRSRNDNSRYSRYLVNDYTPSSGERLIVETSIATPVNIQVAE